jgi:hypothetical protein
LRADEWNLILDKGKKVFVTVSRLALGKPILLSNEYWALFPRAYGGRDMRMTSAEINNAWSDTSVRPYNFMTCLFYEREIRLARQVDYEYLKHVV